MGKIQARIPDEVQEVASAVIKSTGLTVSDAVRMFMTRIARDKALPLDLFQPNPETLQAIEDAEMGRVERTSLEGLRAMIRKDKAEVCKSAK
ncbi:type II toxin-antitoxin system RelB/DinJ family antitoxin [Bartonella krasnovii]|uniref:type II toxin-antitoxin system RelB/DinJ family antitoxin n=1 Tax=Bartonella krasnovii TaxID=2267275 RepID=UPI001F4C52BE|nr:type II toxin-antitoxin system RelB/DinJ family antitoxin [Bartonella krasnovii]UNF39078.1 type II toxin-antitoxin system RelB/DinJ family antitoxin [Bartonella krasnovii]UNF44087.1 type II toxin-antitoxin system RelB/DinJ family antitoxin [Bartonella krasnovii]UNF47275.1 type II toxin-antitoxin system RelB/DinJ family antitoxin [Bartonella krasnovii]UNF50619.1 type II toxin-antitoxin system RelB/DinJ family antitoxin [Bartonella krasnovii]